MNSHVPSLVEDDIFIFDCGLKYATGEYIVLLGSDDYFYKDKLFNKCINLIKIRFENGYVEKFKLIYDINKRYRYFLEVNNEGPEYFTVQITDMGKTIEDIKYELVYKIAKNIFNIVKYRNDGETIKLTIWFLRMLS